MPTTASAETTATTHFYTSFNWALKHLAAPVISVLLLREPIDASILVYLLLGEKISGWTLAGGVMTLIGVGIVLLAESRRDRLPSAEAK